MKFYENYPDTFIVAQINGMIVGYVAGFQAGDGVGRIFSLAVHPLYQRRKIGNSLLNEIIHVFTEMHIKEMILEVRWSNIVAKKFYQKLGFFQYGIAEKYYNNAEDACLMKLRI